MIRTIAVASALVLSLAGLDIRSASGQDEGVKTIELSHNEDGATWDDVDGEASYRITGMIAYLPAPSCIAPLDIPGETIEISQEVPADTTSFQYPLPADRRLTWRKDSQLAVEALDANGNVIARNGFAMQGDQFCTDEEVAAELAAAGTGPGPAGTPWRLPVELAVLGAAAVAAGLALRKAA